MRLLAVAGPMLVLALALGVTAQRQSWRPTLGQTLAVGAGLRVTVALLAHANHWQPFDFAYDFPHAGENVLQHRDPLLNVRPYGWNYLPTMAYVFAAQLKIAAVTGLPWTIAGRLVPVAADLMVTVLVGNISGGQKRLRRSVRNQSGSYSRGICARADGAALPCVRRRGVCGGTGRPWISGWIACGSRRLREIVAGLAATRTDARSTRPEGPNPSTLDTQRGSGCTLPVDAATGGNGCVATTGRSATAAQLPLGVGGVGLDGNRGLDQGSRSGFATADQLGWHRGAAHRPGLGNNDVHMAAGGPGRSDGGRVNSLLGRHSRIWEPVSPVARSLSDRTTN